MMEEIDDKAMNLDGGHHAHASHHDLEVEQHCPTTTPLGPRIAKHTSITQLKKEGDVDSSD
jgi:hypothetical protein